jgi:hypothetical protein
MVYFVTETANARTSGARFVRRTVFDNSSSDASELGRERADSISDGVAFFSGSTLLAFFGVRAALCSGAVRFFDTARFAAFRTCLAVFSSCEISCNAFKSDFEMSSTLKKKGHKQVRDGSHIVELKNMI